MCLCFVQVCDFKHTQWNWLCLGMYLRQGGCALNHEKPQQLSSVLQKWFEWDTLWVQARSVTASAQTSQRCVRCWSQKKHSRYQDTSALNSHGCYLRSLLHETANGEPETVLQRELVLQLVWFLYAWIRIVPLIWADSVTNKTLDNCDWITTAEKPTNQINRWPA
jgi:hypothetical protein